MSKNRRYIRPDRLPLGPNWRPICTYIHCSNEVPKGRKTFCSYLCVHNHLILSSPSYVRKLVLDRDKGICQHCGLDTVMVQEAYELAMFLSESEGEVQLIQDRLRELGFNPKRAIQEADHILEVQEGGGETPLENFQLLCAICHRKKTKETTERLRKEKALAKKATKT